MKLVHILSIIGKNSMLSSNGTCEILYDYLWKVDKAGVAFMTSICFEPLARVLL